MRKRYYEYRHVVGFDETNVVGNVYPANYERWHGRCREMFLLEHAPGVLDELRGDLELATVESECQYLGDLSAFDEVSIRMRVVELTPTRIGFAFDYLRVREGVEELIARGRQQVVCMRGVNGNAAPARVPADLEAALQAYRVVPATYSMATGTGGRA